jgi:hypothetical protein
MLYPFHRQNRIGAGLENASIKVADASRRHPEEIGDLFSGKPET